LAAEVAAMPQKLRTLVEEGRMEEAKEAWVRPRKLLLIWKGKGLGGPDVQRCLDAGDGVFEESASESESEVESS
jgi:vacuolar protein sorting-associated protein 51